MTKVSDIHSSHPFGAPQPITTFPMTPIAPAARGEDPTGDPDFPGILVWG